MDAGRCHICRRTPYRQSELYGITTCEDCDDTRSMELHRRALVEATLLLPFALVAIAFVVVGVCLVLQAMLGG